MSFESSKNLSGVDAILIAVGFFFPVIGVIGIIILLIGVWGLANHYDEPEIFRTAGIILLVGAVLTIIVLGYYLMLIAWIIAAVAFFSIKTVQPTAS